MGEASAARHRPGNADDVGIRPGKFDQGLSENVLIVGRGAHGGFFAFTGGGIKRRSPVEFFRMFHGGVEALALFGENVDQHGDIAVLREFEVFLQRGEVVSIDRAEVAQTKFLEERRFDKEILRLAFPLHVNAVHLHAGREAREKRLHVVMELIVGWIRADPVQVVGNRADVFRDGPLIVVEDDNEALRRGNDVVQRLEGDTAGERGIAAERNDVLGRAAEVAGCRHAEGGGESGAGMSGAEGIMHTFAPVEKTARAAGLAQLPEEITAAIGEQFMDVALMRDVEDKLIFRCGEGAVQRDRQFDNAEIRANVATVFRGDGDELVADLLSELGEQGRRESFDVSGAVDGVEQARGGCGNGGGHLSLLAGSRICRRRLCRPSVF